MYYCDEFPASLRQSSVSHDHSEIILICWNIVHVEEWEQYIILQDYLINREFNKQGLHNSSWTELKFMWMCGNEILWLPMGMHTHRCWTQRQAGMHTSNVQQVDDL